MTETQKHATIWLNTEDRDILNTLSAKTRISVVDMMAEICQSIKKVMGEKELKNCQRISWMASPEVEKGKQVIIRFAPLFCGTISQLPKEIQAQISKSEKRNRK